MFISELLLTICLIAGLGSSTHKERELYTHELKNSTVTYAQLKCAYHIIDDPEINIRLKDVAYFKWCVETDGKYRDDDYYGDHAKVNYVLQKEHFELDFEKYQ